MSVEDRSKSSVEGENDGTEISQSVNFDDNHLELSSAVTIESDAIQASINDSSLAARIPLDEEQAEMRTTVLSSPKINVKSDNAAGIINPRDDTTSNSLDIPSVVPLNVSDEDNSCKVTNCITSDSCDETSFNVKTKCHYPSAAVSDSGSELPSLGILVVDDSHGAMSSSSKSVSRVAENETMKSVSAKIRMERTIDETESSKKSEESEDLKEVLKLSSSLAVDVDQCPNKSEAACLITTSPPELEEPGARRKSEPLPPPAAVVPPHEVLHRVKKIKFKGKEIPIITQNNNGPCPLLAILNALLLRGDVELGVDSREVKGGHLVSIVANALIDLAPRGNNANNPQQQNLIQQNTNDAVQVLDKLLTGLDVNVRFSGVQDFEFTSELCVFDGLSIPLYHGWVVDPEWPAAKVVQELTYNQLTNNILTWRHTADHTNDDLLIMKAVLCEEFLQCTSSQLTVHGLFALGSTMRDQEVAVLFRNNHFSTIYKHKEQLYQLLTDQGFLTEAAVWQTLSDVDASFSEFVTDSFEPWQLQPHTSPAVSMTQEQQMTSDEEIARRLQDAEVRAAESAAQAGTGEDSGATRASVAPSSPTKPSKKKKDQCCIL
ncbi:ubiquitin carboxyl-terminal hydrolase MINDY-1 [Hyalella azteca]|uniref:Ubiquitin carboxyl-terminal hydrolase n=1 Tax=Hyalella azteca TaxID=294128 RepID=A0A8B7PQ21_HYAAZ|nr:ubiquitin carboxyl-terminal hydrolase MINDY-1 [Hyalella azteca]